MHNFYNAECFCAALFWIIIVALWADISVCACVTAAHAKSWKRDIVPNERTSVSCNMSLKLSLVMHVVMSCLSYHGLWPCLHFVLKSWEIRSQMDS